MTDFRYTETGVYVTREYMQAQKRVARWQGFGIGLAVGAALAAASINARAEAPNGPPPSFFPADMPNRGSVWIYECLLGINYHGWGPCLRVEPAAWGQLCDPGGASFAASTWRQQNRPFSYVLWPVYWKCQGRLDPKTAPWPMEGNL